MVIEMVLSQVSKNGDVKIHPEDPLLIQSMRADFHDTSLAAGTQHLGEHLLHFQCFGCGAVRRNDPFANFVAYRPDQTSLHS